MTFKLYYTPTSCGAANFIVAAAGGTEFDSELIDLATHKTASGGDFYAVNPKGNVPTVVLGDGSILNENVGTLVYLADQNPDTGLSPKAGTSEYYEHMNIIGFAATELHQGTIPLWNNMYDPNYPSSMVSAAREGLKKKIKVYLVDGYLEGGKKKFVLGDNISAVSHVVLLLLGVLKMLYCFSLSKFHIPFPSIHKFWFVLQADVYIHRILSWAGYIGFEEAAEAAAEYMKNIEADPLFVKGAKALAAASS